MRLIFCFLMASLMALGQTTGGSLSGSVTDSTGREKQHMGSLLLKGIEP